jgi:sigma-B regulation protein RsbU (phosphoserine phosphatase)
MAHAASHPVALRGTILAVDDEPINTKILAGLLGDTYRVIIAGSGEQALSLARAERPDLILLDLIMPGMDGNQVFEALKNDPLLEDTPVIFITAQDDPKYESLGLAQGAADYISKPIKPGIVRARVNTQMERRHHLAELQRAYAIIRDQKERMERELDVARHIQLNMLPVPSPARAPHPEFLIAARMQPARQVGGDLYDYFFRGDGRLYFCVGDVSGKGVPAALFMAITKALIRSQTTDQASCAAILAHVNDQVESSQDGGIFVTVFLGVLDLATGLMRYANAGHNAPYVLRRGGVIESLDGPIGPALGILAGASLTDGETHLAAGDSLLVYTDGVTEARAPNRDMYGEHRLLACLAARASAAPEDILDALSDDLDRFVRGAEQSDDITVLALQYRGGARPV